MPVAYGAGVSNIEVRARLTSHAIAKRLVTDVCDFTFTFFVARFKNVLLSQVRGHMIVSFDVIVQ